VIAVLVAIESTRGTLISAALVIGEKSYRRAFSLFSLRELRAYVRSFFFWNCVDNERN
jgi:hypothetical protein